MADDCEIAVNGKALTDLRVVDLRKELEKRGLSKTGNKTDLFERLKAELIAENESKDQSSEDEVDSKVERENGTHKEIRRSSRTSESKRGDQSHSEDSDTEEENTQTGRRSESDDSDTDVVVHKLARSKSDAFDPKKPSPSDNNISTCDIPVPPMTEDIPMPSDIPVPPMTSDIPIPMEASSDGKKSASKEETVVPKEPKRTRHWLAAIGKEDLTSSPVRKAENETSADTGDPLAEALIAGEEQGAGDANSDKQKAEVPMEVDNGDDDEKSEETKSDIPAKKNEDVPSDETKDRKRKSRRGSDDSDDDKKKQPEKSRSSSRSSSRSESGSRSRSTPRKKHSPRSKKKRSRSRSSSYSSDSSKSHSSSSRSRSPSQGKKKSDTSTTKKKHSPEKSRSRSPSKSRSRSKSQEKIKKRHSSSRSRSSSSSRSRSRSPSDSDRDTPKKKHSRSANKSGTKNDLDSSRESETPHKRKKSASGDEKESKTAFGEESNTPIQPLGVPSRRRRRWGSVHTGAKKTTSVAISSESLKGLIPEIKVAAIKEEPLPDLTRSETSDSELASDKEEREEGEVCEADEEEEMEADVKGEVDKEIKQDIIEPKKSSGSHSPQEETDLKDLKIMRTVIQDVPIKEEGEIDAAAAAAAAAVHKKELTHEEEELDYESETEDTRNVKVDDPEITEDRRKVTSSEDRRKVTAEDHRRVRRNSSPFAARDEVTKGIPVVSLVVDEPEAARRTPSPPRNPVSRIIHVRNLVRPYTLGQLKEVLGRSGKLVDTGFWIDKIKSHCLATYENEEMASAARHALHGTRWPLCNPKVLQVDFGTQKEYDFYAGVEVPKPTTITREVQQDVRGRDRVREREREERPVREARSREDRERPSRGDRGERPDRGERVERGDRGERGDAAAVARKQHVREWDRDKVQQRSRSRSRSRSPRDRSREKNKRRSDEKAKDSDKPEREEKKRERSRERKEKKEKKQEEEGEPAKLLDDLFCKTKATPCIYWLPLTEEQVIKRDLDRAAAMAERERRRQEREKEAEEERKKQDRLREERRKQREKEAQERNRDRDRDRDRDRSRDRSRERSRDRGRGRNRSSSRTPPRRHR